MTLEARIAVEPMEIVLTVENHEMVMYGLNVIAQIATSQKVEMDEQEFLPVEIVWHS